MAGKTIAVFGVYPSYEAFEVGIDALRRADFRATEISVMYPENVGTKDLTHENSTKAPEAATTGAGTGALVGGTLGWLIGVGALAIPGLGPFVAGGPIMAALAGAGVGGTLGGVTGALIGIGIPEYEAQRYEGRVVNGGVLVSVHSDNAEWTNRAKRILEDTGAEDVSTGETEGDIQHTDKPMLRGGATS